MGLIEFESWNVKLKDIDILNMSQEVSRMGLVFEQIGDFVSASARGNISAYYCILGEVREQIDSGRFNVIVEMSTGEKSEISLSSQYVIENNKDISSLIRL